MKHPRPSPKLRSASVSAGSGFTRIEVEVEEADAAVVRKLIVALNDPKSRSKVRRVLREQIHAKQLSSKRQSKTLDALTDELIAEISLSNPHIVKRERLLKTISSALRHPKKVVEKQSLFQQAFSYFFSHGQEPWIPLASGEMENASLKDLLFSPPVKGLSSELDKIVQERRNDLGRGVEGGAGMRESSARPKN